MVTFKWWQAFLIMVLVVVGAFFAIFAVHLVSNHKIEELSAVNSTMIQDLALAQQGERAANETVGQLEQSSADDFNRRRNAESKLDSVQKELDATKAELNQARRTAEWFRGFPFEPEIVQPLLVMFDRRVDQYERGFPINLGNDAVPLLEYVVQVGRGQYDENFRADLGVQLAPRMVRLAQHVDPDKVIIGGYTVTNWLKDLPKG